MPIDPDVAIGARLPERAFSWSEPDVQLYQLAIGATDLRHTLETADLQVLPSFAVVAPTFHETDPPPLDLPGCDIDLAQVVHGSQEVAVHGPLPTSGRATLSTHISDVWDKGKAAVIWQEGTARDEDGRDLWTVRSSIFVRGEGGWGGERGTSAVATLPDREPDADTTYAVLPQQALLYRLCGDRNPLHADPAFATAAGFPAPILHGLCTYGITLREVTEALLGGDAAGVGAFRARFAGVVFPGETLRIRAWDTGEEILVSTEVGDGRPALADGVLTKA
ncbi:MAG: MaoC/PaaZ C-terminal domain-containing protein [Marmoricola sp.]